MPHSLEAGANDLTVAGPLAESEWDKILPRFADANIFHSSEWAQVLADSYGYKRYCFVSHRSDAQSGELNQALCLFEIDSWLTGRRAVSVPFSDEAPVLGNQSGPHLLELLGGISEFARSKKWKAVEVRGTPSNFEGKHSARFYSHELDLTQPGEALFARFDPSVRRALRKAQKLGLQTEVRTDLNGVEEYFDLHCLTRRKHGVPPQPLKFFQNIQRHLIARGMGFTVLARLKGQVLAGAVFLHFRNGGLYKFGASNPAMDHLRPSNLVMWQGIQALQLRNIGNLSLGRTSLGQPGLRRYKLGWGTHERTISYVKFNVANRTYAGETGSAHANWLFGKLPIPLLKRIGALLYPHIG